MLHAQLHSFDIILHFQQFLSTQVLWAHILFCYTADNTMQRDDFATKFCKTRILSQNCDWIFSLISSPAAILVAISHTGIWCHFHCSPIMLMFSASLLQQTYIGDHTALVCGHLSGTYLRWCYSAHVSKLTGCLAWRVFSWGLLWSGVWSVFANPGVEFKHLASHPETFVVCHSQNGSSKSGEHFDNNAAI